MAKAHITTTEGIDIKLDGTPEEIAAAVNGIRANRSSTGELPSGSVGARRPNRAGLPQLISLLIEEGFFRSPQGLGSIKNALAEKGHHYPVTTLSGAMLSQVKKRSLRRLRQNKLWVYAQ